MVSPKESSHEINVINFDLIIEAALGIGKDYNPAKAALAVSALKAHSGKCREANRNVQDALSAYKSLVDKREAAFNELRQRLTRVFNSMKASDITPGNISTAKELIRKAQGRRVTSRNGNAEVNAENESASKKVSVSQMGFDNQIKNSSQAISFLSTTGFKPNEPDLQVEALSTLLEDLRKMNATVTAAASALFDARALRNDLMFKEQVWSRLQLTSNHMLSLFSDPPILITKKSPDLNSGVTKNKVKTIGV